MRNANKTKLFNNLPLQFNGRKLNRKRINRLLNLILKGFERDYIVLSPSDEIKVANHSYTVEEVALRYQPIIYQSPELAGPIPFASKYEVIPRNHELILVYHMYWQDEIHPNPIIHFLYRLFRIYYYGSSLDIESVEIWVDSETGKITRIVFETEPSEDVKPFAPSHEHAEINLLPDGRYAKVESGKMRMVNLLFENGHVEIEVLTWNHDYSIHKGKAMTSHKPPLSFLTDEEYAKERFVRRRLRKYVTRNEFLLLILLSFSSTNSSFCSGSVRALLKK